MTPLPTSLPDECRKAAKIFNAFVDPSKGLDAVIPASVLQKAKGFAFLTVARAGFLVSARAGSGVVIARLNDGSWSAPSAIGTAGGGFGFQVGAEVTEFILILNSRSAVKTFMAAGQLSLGGNVSVAAGPIGRTAEANANISSKASLSAMYSYSRTKGLLAGASIEGSIIVERQDANYKAYGYSVTSKQLLSGAADVPRFAENLIETISRRSGNANNWVPGQDDDEIMDSPQQQTQGYSFGSQFASGGSESPTSRNRSGSGSKLGILGNIGRSRSNSAAKPSPMFRTKSSGEISSGPIASSAASPRFETQFVNEFPDEPIDANEWRAGSGGGSGASPSGKTSTNKLSRARGYSLGSSALTRQETELSETESNEEFSPTRNSFDSLAEPLSSNNSSQENVAKSKYANYDPDDGYTLPPNRYRSNTVTSAKPTRPGLFARARSASSPWSSKNKTKTLSSDFIDNNRNEISPFENEISAATTSSPKIVNPFPKNSSSQKINSATPWDSEETSSSLIQPLATPTNLTNSGNARDNFDFSQVESDFTSSLASQQTGRSRSNTLTKPASPTLTRSRASTVGKGLGQAIALYDFAGVETTDLPFNKGDVLTILDKTDSEWFKARLRLREGIVPANYLDLHLD